MVFYGWVKNFGFEQDAQAKKVPKVEKTVESVYNLLYRGRFSTLSTVEMLKTEHFYTQLTHPYTSGPRNAHTFFIPRRVAFGRKWLCKLPKK